MDKQSNIYCGQKTWLEGPAVEQFKRVMNFPAIMRGAAFPDLHPGRGVPVGAAFLSRDIIYPALIGNDIGCGMTLFNTIVREHKFKKDKLFRRLGDDVENAIKQSALEISAQIKNSVDDPENILGTLGHGNHFAEFLSVEKVVDKEIVIVLNFVKNIYNYQC